MANNKATIQRSSKNPVGKSRLKKDPQGWPLWKESFKNPAEQNSQGIHPWRTLKDLEGSPNSGVGISTRLDFPPFSFFLFFSTCNSVPDGNDGNRTHRVGMTEIPQDFLDEIFSPSIGIGAALSRRMGFVHGQAAGQAVNRGRWRKNDILDAVLFHHLNVDNITSSYHATAQFNLNPRLYSIRFNSISLAMFS